MKSLVILLLTLSASAFAAEITPYNVNVRVQDFAGHSLSGANRGVFLVGDFRRGNEADIERRFKAQTDTSGQANIPVNKSDYWSMQFNHLEIFCLNLDDALYCSSGADDRDVLTPLNPYPGTEQSKVKYTCAYSMKNPLISSSSAGEIAVACKGLN
jgi:hypothetical protein